MVENVFLNLCIPFSIRSPLSLIPRPVSEFSLEKNLSGTSGETELYAKNTDTDQEVQPEVQEQQEGSLPADMEQYQYVEPAGQFAAMQNGFLVTSLNFGKPALESRIKNVLYVTWYGTNSASLQAGQLAVPDQHVVLYVRAPAEGICRGSFDVCHTGSSIFLESCIDNKIH